MSTLDLDTLGQVTGGVASRAASSTNDTILQSLTQLQTTIGSLANNNNNNQNNLLLPMVMMAAMNRRQSVVSAGGATVVG